MKAQNADRNHPSGFPRSCFCPGASPCFVYMNTTVATSFQSDYLSSLLNSINASVVATDENFIIRYWNKCAELIFERSAEDAIGKRGVSVLHFSYPNDDEETARAKLLAEGSWKGKLEFEKKSGKKLVLDASVSIVRNFDGQIIGYVGVHRDITELSRVKNDLSTLLSTLSNIDDNFFIVDRDLRIAFVDEKSNRNLQSYYGITYNPGDRIVDKLPEYRREQVRGSFLAALSGEKKAYEVNISTVDNKSVWLQRNYFPIKDHEGTVTHACLIVRDITARKQIEQVKEKLYQSRKHFETFMEHSPTMSWITDVQGVISYLNPAYLKAYRLGKQHFGKSVFEIFPEAVALQIRENNELVVQTNQPIKTIERGITPDNREHIYQVVKFPIASDDGTYVGGWAIDITDEIQLREHLRSSLEKLQQSERDLKEALAQEHQLNSLKSRFISIASHEFRTPLSTMLSSVFLLEKYTATEQHPNRQKHINKIKESIEHMNSLLEDVLSLGKIEEGKTLTAPSSFDLSELILDVVEETEPIRRKGQVVYFDPRERREIFTDKKLFKNILVNLLSNAYKFSGENKRIWIKDETCDHHVRITVKDEGMGICPEDQPHLFETFFRARNVQNIQGTGLGLHIVKRYAELLQGHVELESELEKGTTVAVILPMR